MPSSVVLRKMMKETFSLKYASLEKANLKYRDPDYNKKRLWVSRLLGQLITDGAIIVSIDESNFKHDALPKKQWQFNQSRMQLNSTAEGLCSFIGKRKRTPSKKQMLGVLNATDDMLEPPRRSRLNRDFQISAAATYQQPIANVQTDEQRQQPAERSGSNLGNA